MRFSDDKEGKSKQSKPIELGLRPNIQQFLILILDSRPFDKLEVHLLPFDITYEW